MFWSGNHLCSNIGIGLGLSSVGLRTQHVRLTIQAHIDVSEPNILWGFGIAHGSKIPTTVENFVYTLAYFILLRSAHCTLRSRSEPITSHQKFPCEIGCIPLPKGFIGRSLPETSWHQPVYWVGSYIIEPSGILSAFSMVLKLNRPYSSITRLTYISTIDDLLSKASWVWHESICLLGLCLVSQPLLLFYHSMYSCLIGTPVHNLNCLFRKCFQLHPLFPGCRSPHSSQVARVR